MVNRIPAYLIGTGEKFAILAGRAHPHSVRTMAEAYRLALRSSFAPSSYLAALEDASRFELPIATAPASTDLDVQVVPGLVPCGAPKARQAAAGKEAIGTGEDLANLATLVEELTIASSGDVLDELAVADINDDVERWTKRSVPLAEDRPVEARKRPAVTRPVTAIPLKGVNEATVKFSCVPPHYRTRVNHLLQHVDLRRLVVRHGCESMSTTAFAAISGA